MTTLLASYYHAEKHDRAGRHFAAAQQLATGGHLEEATHAYRAGLALDRDNGAAQRGLALTLLALGHHAEAATYFDELLRRDPTDGQANRGMARAVAVQSRPADAIAFYQRAIYGRWPDTMPDARTETRFELVEYLRTHASQDTVHAELLRLKADVPPERTELRRRIARMLAGAGAGDDAVATLRESSSASPRDVALLSDLADAEIATGAWAAARRTLRRALAIDPGDALRTRSALVDRVLTLDPTAPRLRSSERRQRARRVLAAVVAQTDSCAGENTSLLRTEGLEQLRSGRRADDEAADAQLELASRIWDSAPGCQRPGIESRALSEVLRRVRTVEDREP